MAATVALSFLLLLLLLGPLSAASPPPTHFSSATLLRNYGNMLQNFKIFIYTPAKSVEFSDGSASLFYGTLRQSQFLTADPEEAHLFFVPFSPDTSSRSLGRVVREIRNSLPYWNRTLGADHFFLSPEGIEFSSDRNVLELKKNSIQVSVFPVVSGNFIPHKDLTLPPVDVDAFLQLSPAVNSTQASFLGYLNWDGKTEADFVRELMADDFFLVDKNSGPLKYSQHVKDSKFCLFLYRGEELAGIAAAMASGCVPVMIVDRPIQDLPLMDVLRWPDLAFLVTARPGGAERLKRLLNGVGEKKYSEMKKLCTAAATHLRWNAAAAPQPFDAFHMVMYQLWIRRHAVRYVRREPI